MSKLAAALAWASRGFRVFPLRAGTKLPLNDGWTQHASCDPEQVSRYWRDPVSGTEFDHNIGVLTSELVVADVDMKNGKNGLASLYDMGLDFDTLTVRTPTGGYHLYYTGPSAAGTIERMPGLDIRSWNNYVIAPGSTVAAGEYTLEIDEPVRQVPPTLSAILKPPRVKRNGITGTDFDSSPEAVACAAHWLERDAPRSIKGMSGDATAYQVACRVRDFGVAVDEALGLMLEHWNPRNEPNWEPDKLRVKVENAYAYATGEPGLAAPGTTFGAVSIIAPPPFVPAKRLEFGNAFDMSSIKKRPWVIDRLLMRGNVTVLNAAGSAGKSTLVLTIAAHLAVGQSLYGFRVVQPGKSIVYNAEDDVEEQSRRLHAICTHFRFDFDHVRSMICLADEDTFGGGLRVAGVTETRQMAVNADHLAMLVEAMRDPEVVMFGCDPLVEIHDANENDNNQMRFVMQCLRLVAKQADVSVLVAHHTKKPGGMSAAGDADASRGASAVTNAARVALTLVGATEADCTRYMIPDDQRTYYVRLDDAKMNLALASGEPTWLRKHTVNLASGDSVGVFAVERMSETAASAAQAAGQVLYAEMIGRGLATATIAEAATMLQTADHLYGTLALATVKERIERMFAHPVEFDTDAGVGRLKLDRVTASGNRTVCKLVID
jgi:hypothetical protein